MDVETTNQEDFALIPIDNLINNDSIKLNIVNYYGQTLEIDIKHADRSDFSIEELEINIEKFAKLKFLIKKSVIKIKNLIIECSGLVYKGGAEVKNLSIYTDQKHIELPLKPADKIKINEIEDRFGHEKIIRSLMPGFNIIPGSGEYTLNNTNSIDNLKQIKTLFPNTKWISPVVTWFSSNLDIAKCRIQPGFDQCSKISDWEVAEKNKFTAYKISLVEKNDKKYTNYGSTINDQNVVDFLKSAKLLGFKIAFYPLFMIDMKDKPWIGRVTGSSADVDKFYKSEYKPFISHYANLVKGLVDAFIIGSELVGLTKISEKNLQTKEIKFPFIDKLIDLAELVRKIVGKDTKLTLKEIQGIQGILGYMFHGTYRTDTQLIYKNNKQKIEFIFERFHKILKGKDWCTENTVLDDLNIFDSDEKKIILQVIDCLNLEFPDPDHYVYFSGIEPQELEEIQSKLIEKP